MEVFSFSWNAVAYWFSLHFVSLLVIFVITWLALRFGRMLIEKIVRKAVRSHRFGNGITSLTTSDVKKRQDTLISMFAALWTVGVWLVAILTVLQEAALFDTVPLFASAGIAGIALGFGAQSIIKDLLTGVFIMVENQYRVGDVVDLEGAVGTVERITIRSTILRDADGNVHYMPNGNVTHVINKTMGFSRVNFSLAVEPSTNVDHLAELINDIGKKLSEDEKWADKILEAPHFLTIGSFTDIALEVKITGTTQPSEQWTVTGEVRKRLLSAFKKHKIELAQLPLAPLTPPKR
jgi:small-conductance mechanosensitive channel